MAPLSNDKKELRKGEKFLVSIEELLHDTILVVLEHRGMKFCGVLLNTSKRSGPYGIEPEINGMKIKEMNVKTLNEDPGKTLHNLSFPNPLETRLSYNQNVVQPPIRNYFKRKRRSRRKVKMDMFATEFTPGRKLLSHNSTCQCDICYSAKPKDLILEERKSKRKLAMPLKDVSSNDSINSNENLPSKRNKKTEKNQIVSSTKTVRRSPIIKISYKSPGGKGQVLKIPSRIHLPQCNDSIIGNGEVTNIICKSPKHKLSYNTSQARAQRVLKKARYERFRYLNDDRLGIKKGDIKFKTEPKVVLRAMSKNDPAFKNRNQKVSPAKSTEKEVKSNSSSNVNGEEKGDSDTVSVISENDSKTETKFQTPKKEVKPQTHSLNVTRCKTYNGHTFCQGDIVWGKIHGFPWWPGKVKFITCKKKDGETLKQMACVDWFQSKTISHLEAHTLEHFSKFFDKRFEKRRKGSRYRRAIQQAKEAEKELTPEVRGLITQFET